MNCPKFSSRVLIHWKHITRGLASKPRVKELADKFKFDLDDPVQELIKSGSVKARSHPGIQKPPLISLPDELMKATACVLADYSPKSLLSDAAKLSRYIWSRHPPLEKEEYAEKYEAVEDTIIQRDFAQLASFNLPEEEAQKLLDSKKSKITNRVRKVVYNWKPITYNDYMSLVYIVARMAPDFASLIKIMSEIRKRDPTFSPLTMLDFGSGIGTGMWAMESLWPGKCREVVCVDASIEINNLADKLLRGGNIQDDPLIRKGGTFFKQYLPMSDVLKYDLVIASRSLFELPDMVSRLRTLDVLWRKTAGYLVIVEAGTNAGYKLVLEARDYILELSKKSEESSFLKGHLFSPCPHDMFCPRYFGYKYIPCNFDVTYQPYTFSNNPNLLKDRYSYVVIKKGICNEGKRYPRMLQDAMVRKGHIICEVCTKYGKILNFTGTKSKHSKECYNVLKYTKGGDLLPIVFPEPKETKTLNNEINADAEAVETGDLCNEKER